MASSSGQLLKSIDLPPGANTSQGGEFESKLRSVGVIMGGWVVGDALIVIWAVCAVVWVGFGSMVADKVGVWYEVGDGEALSGWLTGPHELNRKVKSNNHPMKKFFLVAIMIGKPPCLSRLILFIPMTFP